VLEGLTCGSLVIENAATRPVTTYRQSAPLDLAQREAQRLDPRPVYLLYNPLPSARGETRGQRLADLQRQQMALMLRMDPVQVASSMQQLIHAYDAADQETRSRLMGLPMAAAMMAVWLPRAAKEQPAPPAP
jgi:hypothetical protein